MSDRILKLSSPVQLFPISTDPQKCVFISAEQKKGVHIFLLRYSPPSASPLFFQKDNEIFLTEEPLNIY